MEAHALLAIARSVRRIGAESLRCLEIEHFPVTVVNDIYGGDLYEEGKASIESKPPD